jgi:hypothetical protein
MDIVPISHQLNFYTLYLGAVYIFPSKFCTYLLSPLLEDFPLLGIYKFDLAGIRFQTSFGGGMRPCTFGIPSGEKSSTRLRDSFLKK